MFLTQRGFEFQLNSCNNFRLRGCTATVIRLERVVAPSRLSHGTWTVRFSNFQEIVLSLRLEFPTSLKAFEPVMASKAIWIIAEDQVKKGYLPASKVLKFEVPSVQGFNARGETTIIVAVFHKPFNLNCEVLLHS